jgi:hypothetical protein
MKIIWWCFTGWKTKDSSTSIDFKEGSGNDSITEQFMPSLNNRRKSKDHF